MEWLKNIFEAAFTQRDFAILILFILCLFFLFLGRIIGKIEMSIDIKKHRKDAVKRSKAVITGQVYEQIAPLLPDFPCNINDVQFIGKPVDFIGFCGNSDSDLVDEILFIEVKSGTSALSAREKSVKEAIENHRVRYVEYRVQ